MRLVLFTQNEGPFRMRWMDELARYMDIQIYHIGEYAADVNMAYINYSPVRAKIADISKTVAGIKLYDIRKIELKEDDLILLDGYGFIAQQLIALLFIMRRKKYGITADGGFLSNRESRIKYVLKKLIISNASFFFSTCMDMDRLFCHYGAKKDKIYRHYFSNITSKDILPEPASKERKWELRQKLGLEEGLIFITVGKLIIRKGFDILSDALDLLDLKAKTWIDEKKRKRWKNAVVLIIGGNVGVDYELLNYKFNNKIRLFPFKEKNVLNQYYEASDVFVLPTRRDEWGLVVGEAMACGLPVITTDKCLAGKAMVKDGKNGYLVASNDAEGLSVAMDKMIIADYCKMGTKSIKVAQRYSIEKASKEDIEALKVEYNLKCRG